LREKGKSLFSSPARGKREKKKKKILLSNQKGLSIIKKRKEKIRARKGRHLEFSRKKKGRLAWGKRKEQTREEVRVGGKGKGRSSKGQATGESLAEGKGRGRGGLLHELEKKKGKESCAAASEVPGEKKPFCFPTNKGGKGVQPCFGRGARLGRPA